MLLKTTRILIVLAVLFGSLAITSRAPGQRTVGDICRVKGQGEIQVQGYGLIVGLNGTGDGSFAPMMQSLLQNMALMGNRAASSEDLKNVKNVALVIVTATIPETGGAQFDRIDCVVSSIGTSKSLAGGRLMLASLVGPIPDRNGNPEVYAVAEGLLTIEDQENPTSARVEKGCQLVTNIRPKYTQNGVDVTLVLHNQYAGYGTAQKVVEAVNKPHLTLAAGQTSAKAISPKEVVVMIPPQYQPGTRGLDTGGLMEFLALILAEELPAPVVTKRVFINEKMRSINISGDVTVSPCVVTHEGMLIDLAGGGGGFVAMDPVDPQENPKLKALLAAMNAVSASVEDKIQVIKDLDNNGNLHGDLVIQ